MLAEICRFCEKKMRLKEAQQEVRRVPVKEGDEWRNYTPGDVFYSFACDNCGETKFRLEKRDQ